MQMEGERYLETLETSLSLTTSQGSANVRGEDEDGEDGGLAFAKSLTEPEFEELRRMIELDHIYSRLVESIAPTVYGHEIVKKGLLLQLMGGVHKANPGRYASPRRHQYLHHRRSVNVKITVPEVSYFS